MSEIPPEARRRRRPLAVVLLLTAAISISPLVQPVDVQTPGAPTAKLVRASTVRLSGSVDSNSPATWEGPGLPLLHVFTSIDGEPSVAIGASMYTLGRAQRVGIEPRPPGGTWIEAVVSDEGGTWYGYYHNERRARACRGSDKALPRIGAMRSTNRGLTWEDLGIILEAPPGTNECSTLNQYFVGGVGDFSVMLDHESRDLYILFSQYLRALRRQGVAVARLAWADRDEPVGKATIWRDGVWMPARLATFETEDGTERTRWIYPAATPIYRASESWHDDDPEADAFWGPSVHWNRYLQQYVMLLNRTRDVDWNQEGIYVAFAPRLDDPTMWSAPSKILDGGSWYPQVIGLEPGAGTDKVAGESARFFMTGRSDYLIRFSK